MKVWVVWARTHYEIIKEVTEDWGYDKASLTENFCVDNFNNSVLCTKLHNLQLSNRRVMGKIELTTICGFNNHKTTRQISHWKLNFSMNSSFISMPQPHANHEYEEYIISLWPVLVVFKYDDKNYHHFSSQIGVLHWNYI